MSTFTATKDLLSSQLFYTHKIPAKGSFDGRTVVVTGGNTGLGLEAARHYVRAGAGTVIIACRTMSKGNAAKEDIENTEKSTGVLQVWELDLASYASVKAFAKRCETLPRLDVVLENAGMLTMKFDKAEGHEKTILVNVISTFMLALLLLPTLRNSAARTGCRPYLTVVTSDSHAFISFPEKQAERIFEELDQGDTADMNTRYAVSKLLEILALRHLTRSIINDRYKYPVVINCVTPGLCHSGLVGQVGGMFTVVLKALLARTTEVGSRALVNATGPVGEDTAGEYVLDDRIWPAAPIVQGEEGAQLARRVWEELIEILERECPGITQNIVE